MKTTPPCRVCGNELDDENWSPSCRKNKNHICKECAKEQTRLYKQNDLEGLRLYREAHRDKAKEMDILYRKANPICRVCGVELDDENWTQHHQKQRNYICKECNRTYYSLYRDATRNKPKDTGVKVCSVCEVELNDENWYPSHQKSGRRICIECKREQDRLYREENQEKIKENNAIYSRKIGHLPMSENKECSLYLGVHFNERVLRHIYNDVEVMPFGNIGYDFVCNHGKKIDAKSSCIRKGRNRWMFTIRKNTITDYFLCVAYDNIDDLNPMHVWLIPGHVVNHLVGLSISKSALHKWAEYEQDLSKLIICCDKIKSE